MAFPKHQSACYRFFGGKQYVNYTDLCYSDAENEIIISTAKKNFDSVRQVKRKDGSKQLFVFPRPLVIWEKRGLPTEQVI